MKPNFALSLSHDGISLLHRTKSGWMSVGEASLDDPDLAQQLQILRRTAADLESGGLTSKLILPNSEILYTVLDAPGPSNSVRTDQIRQGLGGLTPYTVDELAFDWRAVGDKARVAVVARETLQEAENFAVEHRFNPVSFVGLPEDDAFPGEPFFGQTRHSSTLLAPGELVEADSQAVRVSVAERRAEPAAPEAALPPLRRAPLPELKVPPAPPPLASSDPAPTPAPTASSDASPAVQLPPLRATPATRDGGGEVSVAGDGAAFSTRRSGNTAPKFDTPPRLDRVQSRLGMAVAATGAAIRPVAAQPVPVADPPAPPPAKPDPKPAASAKPAKAGRKPPKRAKPAKASPALSVVPPAPAKAAAPASAIPSAPPPIGDDFPPERTPAPSGLTTGFARGRKALDGISAPKLPKLPRGAKLPPLPSLPKPKLPKPKLPTLGDPGKTAEAEAMTIFGARGQAQERSQAQMIGLALSGALLVVLALVAAWAFFLRDVATDPVEPLDSIASAPPSAPEQVAPQTPEQPGTDVAVQAPDPVVTTDTGVQPDPTPTPAPVLPAPAPETAGVVPGTDRLPNTVAPGDDPNVAVAALEQPAPQTDATPSGPVTPAPPEDLPRIAQPMTPEAAEARYAATGIWQLDPDPITSPPPDRIDDLYIASIDPVVTSQDAIALPTAPATSNDQRPPSLTPPPAADVEFDFDERGLVRATPDGAVSPEGVPIFSGAPPVRARPRPEGLSPISAPAADDRLRQFKPTPRPGNLIETNERTRLGGRSRTELAALRPTLRPASEQSARSDEAGEEANAPTEFAVVASLTPRGRPADFEKIVAAATPPAQTQTTAPPAGRTDVAAARVPSIPTRASVARQATLQNAINLGRVNLIGVYGSSSDRRALVRLASGRYVKVKVGDRVDGGRVAAIGDSELRYVKGGRNITLNIPSG